MLDKEYFKSSIKHKRDCGHLTLVTAVECREIHFVELHHENELLRMSVMVLQTAPAIHISENCVYVLWEIMQGRVAKLTVEIFLNFLNNLTVNFNNLKKLLYL